MGGLVILMFTKQIYSRNDLFTDPALLFSIIWILRKLSHNSFFNGIDMDKEDKEILSKSNKTEYQADLSRYIFKFTTNHWNKQKMEN